MKAYSNSDDDIYYYPPNLSSTKAADLLALVSSLDDLQPSWQDYLDHSRRYVCRRDSCKASVRVAQLAHVATGSPRLSLPHWTTQLRFARDSAMPLTDRLLRDGRCSQDI